MTKTTADFAADVAKIRGYVKTYLGLTSLNAKQQAALQTDLGTLDKDLAALERSLAAAAPVAAPVAAPAVALSSDPAIAEIQLLTAIGLPPTRTADNYIAAPPQAIFAAASPEQNAELTLLGLFGTPDDAATFPTADYSLMEKFMQRASGSGWEPKPEYADGVWAAYIKSKGA